jgi:hypothetical protein
MADPNNDSAPTTPGGVLANGAKVLGEVAVVPGASLIVDGDVKAGVLHGVVGVSAAIVFGPIGWLAVAANSYSRSVTGHNLYDHFIPSKWLHRNNAADATT